MSLCNIIELGEKTLISLNLDGAEIGETLTSKTFNQVYTEIFERYNKNKIPFDVAQQVIINLNTKVHDKLYYDSYLCLIDRELFARFDPDKAKALSVLANKIFTTITNDDNATDFALRWGLEKTYGKKAREGHKIQVAHRKLVKPFVENVVPLMLENFPYPVEVEIANFGIDAMMGTITDNDGKSTIYINKSSNLYFTSSPRLLSAFAHELLHIEQKLNSRNSTSSVYKAAEKFYCVENHTGNLGNRLEIEAYFLTSLLEEKFNNYYSNELKARSVSYALMSINAQKTR